MFGKVLGLAAMGMGAGPIAPMLGAAFDDNLGRRDDRAAADRNFALNAYNQKEFAQKGLGWRIQDGLKHGIHPLAAIGASTPSYSPVSSMPTRRSNTFANMGSMLAQSIADKELKNAQIELLKSQAELTRSQIGGRGTVTAFDPGERNWSKGGGGRGRSGSNKSIDVRPDEQTAGQGGVTAGHHEMESYYWDNDGFADLKPSEKYSEALEGAGEAAGWLYVGGSWVRRLLSQGESWVLADRFYNNVRRNGKKPVDPKYWIVWSQRKGTWKRLDKRYYKRPRYFYEFGFGPWKKPYF